MGSIKDRNGMGLTEAEDIKKRWQQYTQKLYKKDLHDADNHFAFLHFFFLGMVLIPASCTMLCTKMGTIKDRNSRDLTEAEDIKKR